MKKKIIDGFTLSDKSATALTERLDVRFPGYAGYKGLLMPIDELDEAIAAWEDNRPMKFLCYGPDLIKAIVKADAALAEMR